MSSIVQEIINVGGYKIENNFIHPSKWVRTCEKINPTGGIIHWTGNISNGANDRANRDFFEGRKDTYGSAHLIGDCDSILAAIPYLPNEVEMAYHVGADKYYTNYFGSYPNRQTIGYEMCVNKDGNFRESYKRAVWTLAYLSKIYKWNPSTDIMRHYDITRKDCPLPFLDLILSDSHCKSLGWNSEDIKWMRNNLHIDGIIGERLWLKFRDDVKSIFSAMNSKGEINKVSKYNPQIYKERIYAVGGVLKVVPPKADGKQDYSVKATDVRWMKIDKNKVKFKLVWEPGAKVSDLVKKYSADYGFNFPFFWKENGTVYNVADFKIGDKIYNQGYDDPKGAKQTKWFGLTYRNSKMTVSQTDINLSLGADGFLVKTTPLLVNNGKPVWDFYRQQDGTASDIASSNCQRTIFGIDTNGDYIIAVADGRTQWDIGFNLETASLFMLSKNCVSALNGDGGSSSVIASKSGVLSQNSGTQEAVVHHAILIYLLDDGATDIAPPIQSDWKQEGLDWLKSNGGIEDNHSKTEIVDMGTLGTILKNLKQKK